MDRNGEPAAPSEPDLPVPPAEPARPKRVERRVGTGIMPAVVAGIVLAAIVIVFVAQNTERVELEWLWLDFRTTPGVLVLTTAFVAVVAAVVIGAIVRRNRRIRLNEHEELDRLRRSDAS